MGLNEGAYMAEIIAPASSAVDRRGMNRALLGMPFIMLMRRIVLPQAFRVIVPPLGSAGQCDAQEHRLVSVIGVPFCSAPR